jgi:hypothetical protein
MTEQAQKSTSQPPAKKSNWWKWALGGCGTLTVLAIIILIAGVAGCMSVGKKISEETTPEQVNETNVSGSSEEKQPEQKQEEDKIYKVGDNVKLGSAIITVNKVEFSSGSEFLNPTEGNEWIDLNVTVENTSSDEQYLTTLGQMFIRDNEGNSYQVSSTDKTIENINQILDGTIIANSKRTGWVGFEIKKGAMGLKFQYNASMWGSGTIIVDLGR